MECLENHGMKVWWKVLGPIVLVLGILIHVVLV